MPAPKYDSEVIRTGAAELYRTARWVAFWYAALFAAGGFAGGALLSLAPGVDGSSARNLGAVVVGFLGLLCGATRGFHLRLRAQEMLCQAEIERHLSRIAPAAGTLPEQAP